MSSYSLSKVDNPIEIETQMGKNEIRITIIIVFILCIPTNINAITGTTVALGIALKPTRIGYKPILIVFENPIKIPKLNPTKTDNIKPTTVLQKVSQPYIKKRCLNFQNAGHKSEGEAIL